MDNDKPDKTKMIAYVKNSFNKTTYTLYVLVKAEGGNSLQAGPFTVIVHCDSSVQLSQDNFHHKSALSQLQAFAGISEVYTFPIFNSDSIYCPIISVNISTSVNPARIVAPPAYPEGI